MNDKVRVDGGEFHKERKPGGTNATRQGKGKTITMIIQLLRT